LRFCFITALGTTAIKQEVGGSGLC